MNVTASMPMVKRCPFVDEVDVGTVRFDWPSWAPELHKVADHVRAYADRKVSHEDATHELAERWQATVTTTWRTGGLDVTVTASG